MTERGKKQVILMKGLGVSSGIAVGKAHVLDRGAIEPVQYCHIDESVTAGEIERFKRALDDSRKQLLRIKKKIEADEGAREHGSIIDAHLMMLNDHMLINDTIRIIKEERINAEWALKTVLKGLTALFDKMDDEYLKARGSDIEHAVNRILVNLMGARHESLADIKTPAIVVARDLSPADTAQMVKGKVLAFLTDVGGRTSHTAIIARSIEIPAVVGLESATHQIEDGDVVIIDGTTGTVIVNPSESVIHVYEKRKKRYEKYGKTLKTYRDLPSETIDGRRVKLYGNMEMLDEVGSLIDHGAEGIGLYRTEFLYLNRKDMPTEEEHLAAYKAVAKKMKGHSVVIRTLDIGGDKTLEHMDVAEETNPALGVRAIRYCFKRTDVFKTQLRAILRASAFGNVKILFPMISGVSEVRRAKAILEEAKEELRAVKTEFNDRIEVGVMIEVPSAAIIADLLAKEVDFFSIGTNDLLQYSLAIDRVNEHVAYLYEPAHPAVLRVIRQVAEAAEKAGISVAVCGEMAGEPVYALVFLGLGITHLSMSAFSLLRVKKLIRSVSYRDAKNLCAEILDMPTAKEIENHLTEKMTSLYQDEFLP
jgi:phosphotransferase system enzyme I (PtsI)